MIQDIPFSHFLLTGIPTLYHQIPWIYCRTIHKKIAVKISEEPTHEEEYEEGRNNDTIINIFTILESGPDEEERYMQMILSILSKCPETQKVNFFHFRSAVYLRHFKEIM